jgi:predicted Holliday junction resolvase-like endonuclease
VDEFMNVASSFVGLFKAQRGIFGICPRCGELFRLSDMKISYMRKFPVDWYDKIALKEEKIEDKEMKLEEALREIKEKATEHARKVLLPRLLRKVDPVFTSLGYYPQDVKAIFDPIDFIIFDGMNRAENVRRIVFMDHQTEDSWQLKIQKSVETTIEKGRYCWEIIRISSKTGEIETK